MALSTQLPGVSSARKVEVVETGGCRQVCLRQHLGFQELPLSAAQVPKDGSGGGMDIEENLGPT